MKCNPEAPGTLGGIRQIGESGKPVASSLGVLESLGWSWFAKQHRGQQGEKNSQMWIGTSKENVLIPRYGGCLGCKEFLLRAESWTTKTSRKRLVLARAVSYSVSQSINLASCKEKRLSAPSLGCPRCPIAQTAEPDLGHWVTGPLGHWNHSSL